MRRGREAIFHAAMEVIGSNGYAAASIREICRKAGVTKPVLYYHFRSKDHLYQELMVDCFSFYLRPLLGARQGAGDLRRRLARIIYEDLRTVKLDPLRARFIMRMIFAPEGTRPAFNFVQEGERQSQIIADVLSEAMDRGQIRGQTDLLARAIMGMNLFAKLEYFFTGRPTLTRRRAQQHVDLLLQGCAAGNLPIGKGRKA